MKDGSEKRRYSRINNSFIVRFQVLSDGKNSFPDRRWDMVTTKNLSAGGLLMSFDRRISEGAVLAMKITFPMTDGPIQCTGKVVRVEKISAGSMLRAAVSFMDISADTMATIEQAATNFYPHRVGFVKA